MKRNLKNNIGKKRGHLSQSQNRNKAFILPEYDPRRIDQSLLSNPIGVSSSSANASVFSCGNVYSGPVMLDFGLQTVHRLSSEHLGFSKANDSITSRELRLRDAVHTNETPPSLPTFFSRQRLKRSNVTDKPTHKRRKKNENAAECSNVNNVNSVVQDCLQSTTNTDDTHQVNGRCLSQKSSQVASVNVVCGYTQRAQSYESARTFVNAVGLPLDSSEKDFTQSLYVNEKRKASADMTARSLRQCLSRSRLAYGSNNNFPTSTSASDFNNDFQSDTHHEASDATEGLDTSHTPLLPIDQRTTGFSQPSRDAPVVLQHTEQQYDLHSTEGTSINNGGLSQSTPTSYVAEPVRLTTRRKSTPNMRTRSVRRRLSTSGSQSGSFEHGSQQPNVHQSEDQSLLYEDLGDCNERCRYCNAAFWHGERLKGHRDATYHLCCGGGKVYIQSEPEPPDYIPWALLAHFLFPSCSSPTQYQKVGISKTRHCSFSLTCCVCWRDPTIASPVTESSLIQGCPEPTTLPRLQLQCDVRRATGIPIVKLVFYLICGAQMSHVLELLGTPFFHLLYIVETLS